MLMLRRKFIHNVIFGTAAAVLGEFSPGPQLRMISCQQSYNATWSYCTFEYEIDEDSDLGKKINELRDMTKKL